MNARSNHDDQSIEHFQTHGWMRVAGAFGADVAHDMRAAVWAALSEIGVYADRPETWTAERPSHLQHLKNNPVFQGIGSQALLAAIDRLFDGLSYALPKDWGAFFLAFPTAQKWNVPNSGWHIDAHYLSALWPLRGLKSFAFLGDVTRRGGGTQILNGSTG
jgi:hypothetical protein